VEGSCGEGIRRRSVRPRAESQRTGMRWVTAESRPLLEHGDMKPPIAHRRMLIGIKLLHSAVWLLMVGCIMGIPTAGLERRFRLSAILSAIVLLECAVLGLNGGKCPLTNLAERFTGERSPNFDIYLPLWLARHNKLVFGWLYVAGMAFTVIWWRASMR
jgi:hypothetical protein